MAKSSGHYRFRKHDTIGANDAENDHAFLESCFQDTGDVDVLLDCKNPKRIVLGRTGAGKSALLLELRRKSEKVIEVHPEELSFNYLTNSTILPYLTSLGVNLDPFYKLLWRHVFAVTIIQNRIDIVDAGKQRSFIDQITDFFSSRQAKTQKNQDARRREKALQYLSKWGDRFFEDIEYRTKEVVTRFEQDVQAGLTARASGSIAGPTILGKSSAKFEMESVRSEGTKEAVEATHEIIERAQKVVSSIQVQELGGILDLLAELLDDPMRPVYITIDRLDERWADDDLRMKLLKGLVDTVKEFGKVPNAKIIICLRVDLLEQLFRLTRSDLGFQEDKYRSLNLPLIWTKPQLISLLNKRVGHLIQDAYTGYLPTLGDILPPSLKFGRKKEVSTIDYILDRTWFRPRDAIEFLNACISKSEGDANITKDAILDAEGEYSRGRFRALAQEWYAQYPSLPESVSRLLAKREPSFPSAEISNDDLNDWSLHESVDSPIKDGELYELAKRLVQREVLPEEVRRCLLSAFYKTGCVGLKTSVHQQVRWASSESYSVSPAEIDDETRVYVHAGLWRVLGIRAM